MEEKRRRGRPARPPAPGERVPMSWRVTPGLKAELDRLAAQSGRSVAQEIEQRLEASFQDERRLKDAFDLMLGPQFSGIVILLAYAMRDASEIAHRVAQFYARHYGDEAPPDDWVSDPFSYDQMVQAATMILEALRPEGERVPPSLLNPQIVHGVDLTETDRNVALAVVTPYLDVLSGRTSDVVSRDHQQIGAEIREKLGDAVVDRIRRNAGVSREDEPADE
jgi:hypothetical protein